MTNKNVYALIAVILIAVGVIAAVRINKLHQSSSDANALLTKQDQTNTSTPAGCPDGKEAGNVNITTKFTPTIDIANKVATVETNFGQIKISFYDKDAPKTVENFICLAEKGYYNNVTFHRLAKDFVIQGGDPTGTGAGGESIYGGKFEDEIYSDSPSVQTGYVRGTVAMANAGPNTNGSQFFIMLKDQQLPPLYTIFGKVISGMDVVDKIAASKIIPRDPSNPTDGAPAQQVIIKSVTIQ